MARNPKSGKKKGQDRRPKPSGSGGRPRRGRPKVCVFCSEHATWVDYKDVGVLRRFVSDRGRIKARGATGTCAQHQRDVAIAVKTARELALIPYSVRTASSESRGGRGADRRGSGRATTAEEAAGAEVSVASPETGDEAGTEDVAGADADVETPAAVDA